MNVTIQPGPRQGRVRIPASKSQAHRLLICAARGEGETELLCGGLSADIRATIDCLKALGAGIRQEGERLWDIAKAYGTTTGDIVQANALEEESLPMGQLLLIPKKR